MSETPVDPTTGPVQVTVSTDPADNRSVLVNGQQVFIYVPAVVDTSDPRISRILEQAAWQVARQLGLGAGPYGQSAVIIPTS